MTTIQQLNDLSNSKNSSGTINFIDGSLGVKRWAARSILSMYNIINDDEKKRMEESLQTTKGFFQCIKHIANCNTNRF